MKPIFTLLLFFISLYLVAQDNIYPAPAQTETIVIKNGILHTATGQVIPHGSIVFKNGKIEAVGANIVLPAQARIIDATGQHVYPGLILPDTDLGLKEIGSGVRGSNDYSELGEWNPNVKSIGAYDATSMIINTLRSNGVLLAQVSPRGNLLTGTSSVVQLDAWNAEDAAYKKDNGMYLNLPRLMQPMGRFARMMSPEANPLKSGLDKINEVQQFFTEARAYFLISDKKETNLKFEALRPLFEKKQKLFINANTARQILWAIDFKKKFGFDIVIVGASDSYLVADLLKQNNISVILSALHNLPTLQDDAIDQPYKTPAILQNAGVLFALNDDHANARYRNLPFNAGTAVAYGLNKEDALKAITLNAAKILGIDSRTGSLEAGKDANIIISSGDLLDMRNSKVIHAFIQGREIDLNNKQTQLFQRYKTRYGIN